MKLYHLKKKPLRKLHPLTGAQHIGKSHLLKLIHTKTLLNFTKQHYKSNYKSQ